MDAKITALDTKIDAHAAATDAKIAALGDKLSSRFEAIMWLLGLLLALGIATPVAKALNWI